jgi:prevent-host-death family protein
VKTISALEVRAKFGQVLDEAAAGERFIVERAGAPIAAIVPLRDLELSDPERIRARRLEAVAQLRRMAARSRKRYGQVDAVAMVREDRDHGHGEWG